MGYLNSVLSSSSQVHADDAPVSGGGLSQNGKFSYGYASSPGKRSSMEDFYETRIDGVEGEIVGLFGVFDGHGGARAAEYVKQNLFSNLIRHPKFISDTKSAIADAYSHTDSEFLKSENNQNRDAGSTASTAILVGDRLLVANVGDSRAVICRGGNAIAVSRDHKPDQTDERQRIEDAGGFVMWAGTWRVGGVLLTLEESDLCEFLKMLHKHVKPRVECKDPMDSSYLFEVVVSKCRDCGCFDQILLLNAVFNYGRQLLRLLRDEGAPEDQAKLQDIVYEICAIPGNENSMAPIIKGGSKLKIIEAFKLMGLQSWVLFYSLSEKCQTLQSWESLFIDNAISFRKYDKYSFLHGNEAAEEGGSDLDYRASKKIKQRKKSSRRKRRRDFDYDDNELLDFDTTTIRLDVHSTAGSWLLSLDGYSASWNSADLPEYLSKYCLSRWIKWTVEQGDY